MFEILVGDVFHVDGDVLVVFKLRLGVIGSRVNSFVHYSYRGEVMIRPAETFCLWLAEQLEQKTATNVNRPNDFVMHTAS